MSKLAILWAGLLHDLVTAHNTSSSDSDKAPRLQSETHTQTQSRSPFENLSIKQLVISHYKSATVKYPIIYSLQ